LRPAAVVDHLLGASEGRLGVDDRIVCLLATASVADDRIVFTSGTSPQKDRGPIRFELVRRCGKWDKQNRTSLELCPGLTCQDLSPKAELLPPEAKTQLKRITLLACSF
jgi:hypothetical protein